MEEILDKIRKGKRSKVKKKEEFKGYKKFLEPSSIEVILNTWEEGEKCSPLKKEKIRQNI